MLTELSKRLKTKLIRKNVQKYANLDLTKLSQYTFIYINI
jgi:hypothetical protein